MFGKTTFPKNARLYESGAYVATLARKHVFQGKHFRIYVKPNSGELARLGIIVSKRIEPSAVKRNRCRRLIRETFRRMRADLPSMDFVVQLSANVDSYQTMARADLDVVLRRAATDSPKITAR